MAQYGEYLPNINQPGGLQVVNDPDQFQQVERQDFNLQPPVDDF